VPDPLDIFFDFASEFADGERWRLLRSQSWDDFQERLAEVVGELPVRRRQALMMLLFALIEGFVDSDDLADWMSDHDLTRDEGIEEMIGWLRDRRLGASDN
jgi:hypothetical protein